MKPEQIKSHVDTLDGLIDGDTEDGLGQQLTPIRDDLQAMLGVNIDDHDLWVHRESGTRFRTYEADENSVSFSRDGGGFVTKISRERFLKDMRPATDEDLKVVWVRAWFDIDDGEQIPGWKNVNQSPWNGWEQPEFEEEGAKRIIEKMWTSADDCKAGRLKDGRFWTWFDQGQKFYDPETATEDQIDEMELDIWGATEVQTSEGKKTFYSIGSGSWCWDLSYMNKTVVTYEGDSPVGFEAYIMRDERTSFDDHALCPWFTKDEGLQFVAEVERTGWLDPHGYDEDRDQFWVIDCGDKIYYEKQMILCDDGEDGPVERELHGIGVNGIAWKSYRMDWMIWQDEVKVGDRVRLTQGVDRFPHFLTKAGLMGTVVKAETNDDIDNMDASVEVEMDDELEGADEWCNCIIWETNANDLRYLMQDIEVIKDEGPTYLGNYTAEGIPGKRTFKAVGLTRRAVYDDLYEQIEVANTDDSGNPYGMHPFENNTEWEIMEGFDVKTSEELEA